MKKAEIFLVGILFTNMFNSCISISTTASFSYEKTGSAIDHSFETTGTVIETGYLTYIEENIFPWQKKKKAEPRNGINISGIIRQIYGSPSKVIKWVHPSEDETLFIGPWYLLYRWDGAIVFDGKTEQAKIVFNAYSRSENGYSKSFEYSGTPLSAHIGPGGVTTSANEKYMELRFLTIDTVKSFPCPVGTLATEKNAYKLYMTKEIEYILKNNSGRSDEEIEQRFGILEKTENSLSGAFYRQGQKFQVVDDGGAVVAEICDDAYTLYDTLPKQDLSAIKRDIAWFYTYRHLTKYLNSLRGW
jgi:hypothetical protein